MIIAIAPMAQLAEHLPDKQKVKGSRPFRGIAHSPGDGIGIHVVFRLRILWVRVPPRVNNRGGR